MTDVNEQIPSYSFSFLHAYFFLVVELCYFSFSFFVFFSFHAFFFSFFLLELGSFSSLYGVGLFSFWGVSHLFFLLLFFFLVSFPCFLFSGGLVFSLSLSPSIAWTIDSSLFLAASLIVSMEPCKPSRKPYHERYAQILAPNMFMLHSHIHEYGHVRNGWNGHRMLITIEHRNLGIRKHVTTSCSGTKPFYYLWIKGFGVRRRDTIFYAVLFIWPPSRAAPHRAQVRLAPASSKSRSFSFGV